MLKGDHGKFSGDCSGCHRNCFYITPDYDTDLKSTSESSDRENTYEFPDGNIITVGAERFHCAEMFSSRISLAKKPAESTTLLSRAP